MPQQAEKWLSKITRMPWAAYAARIPASTLLSRGGQRYLAFDVAGNSHDKYGICCRKRITRALHAIVRHHLAQRPQGMSYPALARPTPSVPVNAYAADMQ